MKKLRKGWRESAAVHCSPDGAATFKFLIFLDFSISQFLHFLIPPLLGSATPIPLFTLNDTHKPRVYSAFTGLAGAR
jgi:hypothetical protein